MDFRLLGSLEVVGGDGRVVRLAKRQHRVVLAALVLRAGEVVPADALIDAVWPEQPPAGARQALHSHIAHLRRALEPDRGPGSRSGRIVTEQPGYRLLVEAGELDVDRFEAAAAEGRRALAEGRTAAGAELLAGALAEWRGPALAELRDEPFAEVDARRLDQARIDVVEARLGADVDLGRVGAIAELEALVAEHPYRERSWELLLLALYRSGRQTEALRRSHEVRRVLVDAGVEPGPGLQDLEARILAHDPGLAERRRGLDAVQVALPLLGPPHDLPLVGRRAELDRLTDLWASGTRAPATLALLRGEPGVGKTRLGLQALHDAASRGALVLRGRCSLQPLVPYEPFAAALAQLIDQAGPTALDELGRHGPHLARVLPDVEHRFPAPATERDPGVARHRAYQAAVELLRRAGVGRNVVIGIDDLQWAEPATLELLTHLVRAELPGLLLVATVRSTEVGDDHPLQLVVEQLRRDAPVIDLTLAGLSEPEVAQLIRRSRGAEPPPELTAAVHDGTAGNPLFVREVLRTIDGWEPGDPLPFPESVRTLARERLAGLPVEVRELVEAAAVAGSRLDLPLLADLSGRTVVQVVDDLEPARRSGLLTRRSGGDLVFTHDITRSAVAGNLTAARLAELHRAVGEALVRTRADLDPVLDRLARHFARAAVDGDADRAVEFAERAGRRAISLLAYTEAARRFQEGIDALDGAGREDADARLRLVLGRQLADRRAGTASTDLQDAFEALALARRVGTPAQIASAVIGVTDRAWRDEGRGAAVIDALGDALADLDAGPAGPAGEGDTAPGAVRPTDPAAVATVASELAAVTAAMDRHGRAVELVARVEGLLDDIHDDELFVGAATSVINVLLNESPLDDRLALAAAARRRAERSGSKASLMNVLGVQRALLWERGDMAGAQQAGAAYEALVEELRMPRYLAGRAQRRALLAHLRGEYAEAERWAEEMVRIQPHREYVEAYVILLFALRADQGRLGEVLPLLDSLEVDHLAPWRGPKALCLVEVGRDEDARRHLEPYWEQLDELDRHAAWLAATCIAGFATAWVGDPEPARRMLDQLEPEADRIAVVGTGVVCLGSVCRALGPLALVTGDLDAAETWVRRSLEVHRAIGAAPLAVEDQLALASVLDARGGRTNRSAADERRTSALADAGRIGLRSLAVTRAAGAGR